MGRSEAYPWRRLGAVLALGGALLSVAEGSRADEKGMLALYRESAALFESALTAERRGLTDDALAAYTKAVERDPAFVEAIANLARLELAAGRLEAAESWIERGEQVRSDYPRIAAVRGLLALARGDLAHSLESLSQAHRAAPEDAEVAVNLGAVLIQRGRLDEARRVLGALLVQQPDHAAALYNRALADDLSGDRDAASSAYRRFLELAPQDDPAREGVQGRLEVLSASKATRRREDGD
jgi:tetratricopeptide (TPR) repeat protein